MTMGAPLRRARQLAVDAKEAGFDGLVVTEAGRSAYLTCAAAALSTDLDLSTGIAVAFPRSPMVTAQLAWELADATGGHFRLGLGTQVRAHIVRRYGAEFDHPGPRLRDYVKAVRACFTAFRGEAPLAFDGEFYSLSLLPAQWSPGSIDVPDPPIDIAAVNPYMLRVAGEVADGVHIHPLNHPAYLREVVVPNVNEGMARAGVGERTPHLTVPVFTAVGDTDDERRKWRERARAQVAFYGSTPNYAFIFELLGRSGTTEGLRERQKAGDLAGMVALIDDDLLDEFVVSGSFADMPALIVERYSGVAQRVVLYFAGIAWGEREADLARWGDIARGVRDLTPGA
ncbi:MAG TPA: TIGR03617 family F420-dependent LLM class oxidoreductase [Acidimicrobiales bacterium]|nr:TIGR03617 family F420-dependent LLM class oxidoreductase [Acidimicrobiales bacterium]